jgi:trafficking protein particle complex subunit 6
MAAFQPASANPSSANPSSGPVKTSNVVSQQIVTFLFAEIVDFASRQDATMTTPVDGASPASTAAPPSGNSQSSTNNNKDQVNNGDVVEQQSNEKLTVAAEMAAAKLERMGASVGYRLTERLCFSKTWTSTNAASSSGGSGGDLAAAVAAQQLEAVKFLCKDIWPELFNKQIDKLQTNHRGVFVLKDLNFLWLSEAFGNSEAARCHAMLLLAFPCGLIRGVLSNLGIPAAVSCDFLSDGVNMASCAFNIKVK